MSLTLTISVSKEQVPSLDVWDATRGGFADVEPGLYEVTTKEIGEHGATVKFTVEGPFGRTDVYQPKDMTKDANIKKMLATLASHGAKVEKVKAKLAETGAITIGDQNFVGKKAFLLVTLVEGVDEKGRKKLNDKAFVTPEQAVAWKAANKNAPATPAASSSAAPTGGAAPAAGGGVGDLFND